MPAMFTANIEPTPQCSAYLLPLSSMQPQSYGLRIDHTKARLAYGSWGIPQLCVQLTGHRSSQRIQLRRLALGTLCDELIDPEKCYRAQQKCQAVLRLRDLMLRELQDDVGLREAAGLPILSTELFENTTTEMSDEYKGAQTETLKALSRALECLRLIAGHLDGALEICNDAELMAVLMLVVTIGYCAEESALVLARAAEYNAGELDKRCVPDMFMYFVWKLSSCRCDAATTSNGQRINANAKHSSQSVSAI